MCFLQSLAGYLCSNFQTKKRNVRKTQVLRCQCKCPYFQGGAVYCPSLTKGSNSWKMTFLVNEQNVSVMFSDINAISLYFDLSIFQQDVCFCSKLRMEVEYRRWGDKTSYLKNVKCSGEQKNFNTIMNGTAFYLPCHSGSIFSEWNLSIWTGQNLVS